MNINRETRFRDFHGYSLVELIVVMLFVGALALIAIPRMNYGLIKKGRAEGSAYKFSMDLQRARSLAIMNASTHPDGYAIVLTGGSPYEGYKIFDVTNMTDVEEFEFNGSVNCTSTIGYGISGLPAMVFGPLGNVTNGDGEISFSDDQGNSYVVSVVASTGMTSISEN
jgi:Tfp pilus assembly protein FimT